MKYFEERKNRWNDILKVLYRTFIGDCNNFKKRSIGRRKAYYEISKEEKN